MKKLMLVVLCGLIVQSSSMAQTTIQGRVVEVIEGDIMKVVKEDGETLMVKLRNVECPEMKQEFGDEAKRFTEKRCFNEVVTVIFESYDRHHRALGEVTTSRGRDLGYELIERGLAWHYSKGLQLGPDSIVYMALEKEVKGKAKGLWGKPQPVAPWTFRARQNRWKGKTSI